jgi:hypothetical protein
MGAIATHAAHTGDGAFLPTLVAVAPGGRGREIVRGWSGGAGAPRGARCVRRLFELAAAVPMPDPARGGRPRIYPAFMWVLFDALLSVYGSARKVEAELSHPLVWAHLRGLIARSLPDQPLPAAPMRRLPLRPYSVDDPARSARRAAADPPALRRRAGPAALDPEGPGSWTHPDLARMLYADGKVLTPLFRATPGETVVDRRTGEIRPTRAETDAALHFEGTGETAFGTKWVLVAVRDERVHARVILDADWVPTPGREAATAMGCFRELALRAPGAKGVIYDTALRGVHHQTLLRDPGLLPVNRVTAAKASAKRPRRADGQRVEKSAFVETRGIRQRDGSTVTVSLYAQGGTIGTGTLLAGGDLVFTPLQRVRTHRKADNVHYRWYNDYRLPDELGGGTITVRLHGNDADATRRFNRTENVRPIPPGDPDFQRMYRRRNDAESINRALDDTLWLRRAHSVGHERQHLNLLTYALTVNALAPGLGDRGCERADRRLAAPRSAGRRLSRGPTRLARKVSYRVSFRPRPRSSGDRASVS